MTKTLFIGAGLAALIATDAAAQSAGCADIDGDTIGFGIGSQDFTALAFDADETITFKADNVTSGAQNANAAAFVLRDGGGNPLSPVFVYAISGPFAPDSGPVAETLVVPDGGFTGLGWREDVGAGGSATQFNNISLSCAVAAVAATYQPREAAQVTTVGQQRSIATTLARNSAGRLGGGGTPVATRDSVFLSTQNLFSGSGSDPDANLWVSLSARSYFDGYEGNAADLLAGVDFRLNGDTLLGVMVGAGVADLEDDAAATRTDVDSRLFGLYGAHRFGGTVLTLDGYLAYADLDYDTGADRFGTERVLAGLSLSGTHEMAAGTLTPRARLWGTWEDFPAGAVAVTGGTTRQVLASLGARFDWGTAIAGTALTPFASFDVEYGALDEIGGTTDDFLAPRVGLGLSGRVGGGDLALALDAGRSASDVLDAGLSVSYEMRF
ncbi:Autotransporter beta-domain-containing protein [Rhodovulum sp. ES.010]|uniref:autotransporter outer membrane beta-barrel domain-containing protein n=1 Tax=Rhodovulum sp. ES.010 TaxID=1882821 RepID=UPI000925DE06|nr:autotransporter outer membrane beta-barrel domain-containing protein [Rhodovulum sp. ES.010]SIO54163.1 Autotransporter beta-domain-containing protein [Rhodovulum sp. ES.010]